MLSPREFIDASITEAREIINAHLIKENSETLIKVTQLVALERLNFRLDQIIDCLQDAKKNV